MSLMDRVREAGVEEKPAQAGQGYDELKARVSEVLPPRKLAQIAAENPRQAESEIRRACDVVLQDNPWLAQSTASLENLIGAFIDEVLGLGPLEPYLADDQVTEIMVNGLDSLYVEREGRNERCPMPFATEEALRTLIDRILGPLGRRVDESTPMVDARLASGHRVNAVIPPIAPDGPLLTIRKFASRVLTLVDLEELGTLDCTVRKFLVWAIALRKNIAVSGGTGSGKTTLLNALSCEIPQEERVLTIEDSAELRFLEHPHVVRMESRPRNAEGRGEVTIRTLVKNALRMRPDRIIVGEVRGEEALDMLSAMNTGHEGSLTTLHANSPGDAVTRLTTMVRFAAELPVEVIEAQIASALDVVIQLSRHRDGKRRITQICAVESTPTASCGIVPLFEFDHASHCGAWHNAPSWLLDPPEEGVVNAEEVQQWLQEACLPSLVA